MQLNPSPEFCIGCKEDLIHDCPGTMGASGDQPCIVMTFRRLLRAAHQAGIEEPDLLAALRSGATLREILELISARISDAA